jgi:hypothetical protein
MRFRMRVYNEPLVKAPYPIGFIGDGLTRCAALALPAPIVRSFLPASLELGDQDVTPIGTHPVILLFHGFNYCQFSFPTLLPPMSFHEQTFGIPFTRIQAGTAVAGASGPFYFMPKMYLDDLWVLMVGRNFWGFDKQMAVVTVTENCYTVTSHWGRRLASLSWGVGGDEPRAAREGYPEFEPIRQMLSQPLISLSPAALGPLLTLTDFDRSWDLGTVRPIHSDLELDPFYLPGFQGGRFATSRDSAEAQPGLLGAYELSAQWWLSFPYLPSCSMR